jgi:hypothetical protein
MPWWVWLLVSLGIVAAVYAVFVIVLVIVGRRGEARALATFIPDCIILITRLAQDPRVPRRRKLLLFGLVGYLALPFDLVPDFIPIAARAGHSSFTTTQGYIDLAGETFREEADRLERRLWGRTGTNNRYQDGDSSPDGATGPTTKPIGETA